MLLSDEAGGLEPVHPGHAEVHQDDLGLEGIDQLNGLGPSEATPTTWIPSSSSTPRSRAHASSSSSTSRIFGRRPSLLCGGIRSLCWPACFSYRPMHPRLQTPAVACRSVRWFHWPVVIERKPGDLAEVLDNLGVFRSSPEDLVATCPSGFRRVPISQGVGYYLSLQGFAPNQIAYAHTHPDSEEWVCAVKGGGEAFVADALRCPCPRR